MQKRRTERPRYLKRKLRASRKTVVALSVSAALVCSAGIVESQPAQAATVYELEGEWQASTPNEVSTKDTVESVWRYNVNDDSPAPSNDPVDNVTLMLSVENGAFTKLPASCLTDTLNPSVPLDPVSEISTDGSRLICNFGTRDQGTAELMVSGIEVTGSSGDKVLVRGSVGGVSATTPALNIVNPFGMDIKFDGGNPIATPGSPDDTVMFPWSLRHSPGGERGPSSLTYTINLTNTAGTQLQAVGCEPLNYGSSGHPYSSSDAPADRKASFPGTCSLTRTGTNQFRLTLAGIDYSKQQVPTKDGAGVDLPSKWDVVASGLIKFSFTYQRPGDISLTVPQINYVAPGSGAVVADDAANNSASASALRGSWTGGWVLGTLPEPLPGTAWQNTSLAMAQDTVRAVSGVAVPIRSGYTDAQLCQVLDTKYVKFQSATLGWVDEEGRTQPYAGSQNVRYWYYIGNGINNNLNPNHPNYNPNTFVDCGGTTGWTQTLPSDLSLVKAVRVNVPHGILASVQQRSSHGADLYVDSKVKDDVRVGQDIWSWTSFKITDDSGYHWDEWFTGTRETRADQHPGYGVLTPGLRYPFAGPGRDVLRVVSAKPVVEKSVAQGEVLPGATVDYTLRVRAESLSDQVIANIQLQDVLPNGVEYLQGSASLEPTAVDTGTGVISWTLPDARTNTDYFVTFKARISGTAEPGDVFTNQALAAATCTVKDLRNQDKCMTAKDSASTRIVDGGITMITKTAAESIVPQKNGVANGLWTVRLSSTDSRVQAFTDTIDILPYNGDHRGTDFHGTYKLSGPVVAAGATVYYTSKDPASIDADPAHPSNGEAGNPSGSSIWSTSFMADATAIRVVGPKLVPGASYEFAIPVVTEGASYQDVFVNTAEARADRTKLIMRTSSKFEIGAKRSVTLKKYVQDSQGNWHDANDIDDYPEHRSGDTVPYRLVVTNTGDETLKNLVIEDDKVDLARRDPLPAGLTLLDGKAVIAELLQGEDNRVVIEYEVTLAAGTGEGNLVNNACVVPGSEAEGTLEEDCDPAGITVLPSSLAWEKIAAGTTDVERLVGSEWELTPVDSKGQPAGDTIAVKDCVVTSAADCGGVDTDPEPGKFLVKPLDDGRYRLVETRAPAGYQLDPTPRYIDVLGATVIEQPIENEQSTGPVLPLTGGMGTFAIFLGAGGVGVLVLLGLWLQRRRGQAVRN